MKFISFVLLLAALSPSVHAAEKPEQAALAFYQSYLRYQAGLAGKTRGPKEADSQNREASKPFLTAGYWRILLAQQKKCAAEKDEVPAGCDSDPFYCAQEPPTSATISKADKITSSVFKGRTANVPVALCFNCAPGNSRAEQETRVVQVHLRKAISKWLVEKVDCPSHK